MFREHNGTFMKAILMRLINMQFKWFSKSPSPRGRERIILMLLMDFQAYTYLLDGWALVFLYCCFASFDCNWNVAVCDYIFDCFFSFHVFHRLFAPTPFHHGFLHKYYSSENVISRKFVYSIEHLTWLCQKRFEIPRSSHVTLFNFNFLDAYTRLSNTTDYFHHYWNCLIFLWFSSIKSINLFRNSKKVIRTERRIKKKFMVVYFAFQRIYFGSCFSSQSKRCFTTRRKGNM